MFGWQVNVLLDIIFWGYVTLDHITGYIISLRYTFVRFNIHNKHFKLALVISCPVNWELSTKIRFTVDLVITLIKGIVFIVFSVSF